MQKGWRSYSLFGGVRTGYFAYVPLARRTRAAACKKFWRAIFGATNAYAGLQTVLARYFESFRSGSWRGQILNISTLSMFKHGLKDSSPRSAGRTGTGRTPSAVQKRINS